MNFLLINKDMQRNEKTQAQPSPHIAPWEARCKCCGEAILFEPMLNLFERTRDMLGKPILINSFYRCSKHQQELVELGYKAAKQFAPHVTGAAMDLAIPKDRNINHLMNVFKEAARDLGYKTPRLGHKAYNNEFLHVDLAFMLEPNPCPKLWFPGAEW